MYDTGATLGAGSSGGGACFFQNGVWLSKGRVERVDRFQKWAEDQAKCEVQRLDREEHEHLVKLYGQRLEVRMELRGLQRERRLLHHRSQGFLDSAESNNVLLTSLSTTKELHKSASAGSLASHSSEYSSPTSGAPTGKRGGAVEMERGGDNELDARAAKVSTLKMLSPEGWAASRVKNMHSARALSKFNNNMDVYS